MLPKNKIGYNNKISYRVLIHLWTGEWHYPQPSSWRRSDTHQVQQMWGRVGGWKGVCVSLICMERINSHITTTLGSFACPFRLWAQWLFAGCFFCDHSGGWFSVALCQYPDGDLECPTIVVFHCMLVWIWVFCLCFSFLDAFHHSLILIVSSLSSPVLCTVSILPFHILHTRSYTQFFWYSNWCVYIVFACVVVPTS